MCLRSINSHTSIATYSYEIPKIKLLFKTIEALL
jgi:hypothetical protein